jgi:hypothetical protein
MNIRLALILGLTSAFVFPCLANDPSMMGGGNSSTNMNSNSRGGRQMSPGRDKYTKRRMQELKRQRQAHRDGANNPSTTTVVISRAQQLNNPLAVTAADQHRDAVRKQQLINAIEFLALKKERGELTPKGEAKLKALISQYRSNYTRGY